MKSNAISSHPPWENWYKQNFRSQYPSPLRFVDRSFTLCASEYFSYTSLSSSDNQQVFPVRTSSRNCVYLPKWFPIYLPWGGAHVAVLILSSWTDCTLEPHLRTHRSTSFSLPWCPRSLSSVNEIYYLLHKLLRPSLLLHVFFFPSPY